MPTYLALVLLLAVLPLQVIVSLCLLLVGIKIISICCCPFGCPLAGGLPVFFLIIRLKASIAFLTVVHQRAASWAKHLPGGTAAVRQPAHLRVLLMPHMALGQQCAELELTQVAQNGMPRLTGSNTCREIINELHLSKRLSLLSTERLQLSPVGDSTYLWLLGSRMCCRVSCHCVWQQLTPEGPGVHRLLLLHLLRLWQLRLSTTSTKVGNAEGVALPAAQLALLRAASKNLHHDMHSKQPGCFRWLQQEHDKLTSHLYCVHTPPVLQSV